MNSHRRRFLVSAVLASIVLISVQNLYPQNGVTPVREMEKVVPSELNGDLRNLPQPPEGAGAARRPYRRRLRPPQEPKSGGTPQPSAPTPITPRAPMPAALQNFNGLSFSDMCGGV